LNLFSDKQCAVLDPRIAEIKPMLFGLIEEIVKATCSADQYGSCPLRNKVQGAYLLQPKTAN